MVRLWFVSGSLLGASGVVLGAFAAHGLKGALPADSLAQFETGARYQLLHALALLGAGWACDRWPGPLAQAAGWAFLAGIVIFSGSLYLLALSGLRWLGAIAPAGGLALVAGWLLLAAAALLER